MASKTPILRQRILRALLGILCLPPLAASASLHIDFDYSYDTGGFFSGLNAGRRLTLEKAADIFEDRILDNFAAITPSGKNTWTLSFPNPATGDTATLTNQTLEASTIRIYVGARDLPGSSIGYGAYGYSWSGFSPFSDMFRNRDSATNFDSIGGSISFDDQTDFYFDQDPSTLEPFGDKYDFFSLAEHEIGHLLGFNSGAKAFKALTVAGQFTGPKAEALFGGPIPLSSDRSHFAAGSEVEGLEVSMQPNIPPNVRRNFSELDFAALDDIGYDLRAPARPIAITGIKLLAGGAVELTWAGGSGPYRVETQSDLAAAWTSASQEVAGTYLVLNPAGPVFFYRVVGLAAP